MVGPHTHISIISIQFFFSFRTIQNIKSTNGSLTKRADGDFATIKYLREFYNKIPN